MRDSVIASFATQFGDTKHVEVAMAPGRVNLIGDHTDHNDGFVLPITVDRGVYVALRGRADKTVRVYSVRYDEMIEFPLDQYQATKAGSWASYVAGVIEELRLCGLVSTGFEAVVDGDLDLGAGLSSSAALEVATAIALQHLIGFSMGPVDMVKLCQHVEHSYANVACGIMDQFASRIGRSGHALFLDCRSLEYEHIPLTLDDHRIVIVSSGVERSLAASGYNTRRAECQEAAEYFSKVDEYVIALRDVSPEMFEAHGDELPKNIRQRCRHVLRENQRVVDAAAALVSANLAELGSLMSASHESLRDDFEVSCPEIDMLVKLAEQADGVLGARMTGAGFGGCTVNLVHKGAVASLAETLTTEYPAHFDLEPGIFVLQGNLEAGPLFTS